HWLDFLTRNCKNSTTGFTILDVVTLALVLSQNLCFEIEISNNKARQPQLDDKCIMVRLDEKAAEFLNEMRINMYDPEHLKKLEEFNAYNIL
ncbi:hypothetical protein NPIL_340881, partial [Nephila pilipes]